MEQKRYIVLVGARSDILFQGLLLHTHIGNGRFVGVISFVWWVEVSFWFRYQTPLVFLFTPFNSLASSLSVKAAKELLKEGRKETEIPFKFQLYFCFGLVLLYGISTIVDNLIPNPFLYI